MKRICVVTGSRADYGLLHWVMEGIRDSQYLELQVVATGTHLSPEFDLTYLEIEKDGFQINRKLEMLLSSDTRAGITKSIGLGMIGFADVLTELKPDILLVLGDRYETLVAATAAMVALIPIAHISGGESTEGAFDEAIRHSITKMAWWHFVASEAYAKRVIQLGENSKHIFNVGGLGVDNIKKTKLLTKIELIGESGINFGKNNLIITFHPVTLEKETSQKQFQILLNVLDKFKEIYLIFTMPNADSDAIIIKKMIAVFLARNKERSIAFTSMGYKKYLSTLQFVDGVVGNSSSGLGEAPTFKIGTINIGDRQKGRIKANSVIDCNPTEESISMAIKKLYSEDFQAGLKIVTNPLGEGGASRKIIEVLRDTIIPEDTKKTFYDL